MATTQTMQQATDAGDDERRIRRRIADWADAVRAKDADRVMAHYAPDVVVFDVMPPLSDRGADAYRRHWEGWFASVDGPIGFEMHDLHVEVDGALACCRAVNRVRTRPAHGGQEASDGWTRATVCLRRIDGEWLVTHEHVSVPMAMPSSPGAA